jgi:hypothetical protein
MVVMVMLEWSVAECAFAGGKQLKKQSGLHRLALIGKTLGGGVLVRNRATMPLQE